MRIIKNTPIRIMNKRIIPMRLNIKKIEHEMKRLGWNYRMMADAGGVSRQLLSYYIRSRPSMKTVSVLAKVLNLSPKDLLI